MTAKGMHHGKGKKKRGRGKLKEYYIGRQKFKKREEESYHENNKK